MAYVDFPSPGIAIGYDLVRIPGNPAGTSNLINNAYGFTFLVPKTGTISRIWFRVGIATDPQDLHLVVSTVNPTTFLPTETLWSAGAEAVLSGYSASTSYWVTLDTPISVTKGQTIAFYLEFNSTAGSVNIINAATNFYKQGTPRGVQRNTSNVWTFQAIGANCAVEYDDGSRPHCGGFPYEGHTSATFSNASNPDERGNRFTVPYNCKIGGAIFIVDGTNSTAFAIRLYDSADNLMAEATLNRNVITGTGGISYALFSTDQEILANEVYRIILAPTTTSTIHYKYLTIASGLAEAWPSGENFYYTERTDAGAWTDMDTRIFRLVPLITAIETPGGSAEAQELTHVFAS